MDIAEIGFKSDTSGLEKATLELNKVKSAASGVATATNKVDISVTSAALAVARAKTAEASAVMKAIQANKKATKSDIEKASSALKVAKAEEAKAKSLHSSALANDKLTKATMRNIEAEKRQGLSRRDVQDAAGGIANDNMPNRFNTANVAAQFQDIGVTAAMGMNPLTIALQQGTQLSAILNSMKNPLQGLKAAFVSVINPVSLLSIGIVALVAAGIQMVDWSNFAKSSLNALADAIDVIGPYAVAAVAGLALFYSSTVLSGLATASVAIMTVGYSALKAGTMIASAWLMANPATLLAILAAAGLAIAAWAVEASEPFRRFANVTIGIFKGMGMLILGSLMRFFEDANNLVAEGLNGLIDLVNQGLEKLPESLKKKLGIDGIDFQFEKTNFGEDLMVEGGELLASSVKAGFDSNIKPEDFVGKIGESVGGALSSLSGKFREWASSIGDADGKLKEHAASAKDKFKELEAGANRTIESMKAEAVAMTLSGEAAAKLRYETKLLNEAKQKNIDLTPEQGRRLEDLATTMGRLSEEEKRYRNNLEFNRSATLNFFNTLKNGLIQGKSLWESFGNAVTSVLNRILDKMLEIGVDLLFAAFPMGGSVAHPAPVPKPFAKGGAFTNSVVSKPTMFTFANGGSFGVMGEAGPEAIMPLRRGPDGSLGVQMMGSGSSGGSVVVNINNNSNSRTDVQQRQTSQGVEIDVLIDNIVSEKLSSQGTATNRSIKAFNSRQLIKRG